MITVSQLIQDVAAVMDERPETVNAYARALINDGLLPKSRGRAVATIGLRHVIRLFAAVALEPKVRKTAAVVEQYLSLTGDGVPVGAPKRLLKPAEDCLVSILAPLFVEPGSDDEKSVRQEIRSCRIAFVRNWKEIEVNFLDSTEEPLRFRYEGTPGLWNGYVRRVTVVSAEAFICLGHHNCRDYTGQIDVNGHRCSAKR